MGMETEQTEQPASRRRGRYENTGDWKPAFLASMRKLPNALKAAKAAGVTRQAAYKERALNPEFAAQWDEAKREGIEDVERIMMELARLRDPKHNTIRMFMLRAHMPEVYGDRSELLLRGSREEPIHVQHGVNLKDLSMEELDLLERILSGPADGAAEQDEPGGREDGEGSTVAP